MMNSILGYLFLVIFALTAVLTIASLPGWIQINDWYKKKLFLALILEVVGSVIILYKQSFINPTTSPDSKQAKEIIAKSKEPDSERALSAFKRNKIDTWYVNDDTLKLGYLSLKVEQSQIIADSLRAIYTTKKEYEVENSKFFFIIDSISPYIPNTLYTYHIRFGEQDQLGKINWQEKSNEFYKTPNGEINLNIGLKSFQHKTWQNSYYVGLGVGQPTNNKVNFLNMILIKINIE